MKHSSLLSSILLTTLLYTGCAEKTSPTNEPIRQVTTQPAETIYQEEIAPQFETVARVENPYNQEPITAHYEMEEPSYPQEETITESDNHYNEVSESLENSSMVNTTPPMVSETPAVTEGGGQQLQTVQGGSLGVGFNNNSLTFPQYQGKIILLQIFGKECHFCFEEMPIIQKVQQKYGNRLQVIAIQGEDRMSPSTSSRLIRKFNMNYPIVERDEARELLIFIGEKYGWTGTLPFIQLIKNGSTEYTFGNGGVSYSELTESIDTIL